jgi:hypothetical protein
VIPTIQTELDSEMRSVGLMITAGRRFDDPSGHGILACAIIPWQSVFFTRAYHSLTLILARARILTSIEHRSNFDIVFIGLDAGLD